MFQTKANKRLVGFLWSLMSQSDLLFPDFVRGWSQNNSILCVFASTELQLPPAENNDYWRGTEEAECVSGQVLCLCLLLKCKWAIYLQCNSNSSPVSLWIFHKDFHLIRGVFPRGLWAGEPREGKNIFWKMNT